MNNIGNKEVLRDDALDLAMRAENDNVNWETVIEDAVHNWFVVPEVVKDKSICQRANATFADFCYRAIRHIPNQNLPFKAGTYTTRYSNTSVSSDFSSLRRSSEGLEMVLEDEEEEKREEEYYNNPSDSESGASTANLDKPNTIIAEKVSKQKPRTVFV